MGGRYYDRQGDTRNCRDCCLEIVKQLMGLESNRKRVEQVESADIMGTVMSAPDARKLMVYNRFGIGMYDLLRDIGQAIEARAKMGNSNLRISKCEFPEIWNKLVIRGGTIPDTFAYDSIYAVERVLQSKGYGIRVVNDQGEARCLEITWYDAEENKDGN